MDNIKRLQMLQKAKELVSLLENPQPDYGPWYNGLSIKISELRNLRSELLPAVTGKGRPYPE